MIYTLTANPAIDMNISCDGLKKNAVTRTRDAVYTPNGKGLNVSFTLKHYGVDSTILGFFAGFTGAYIIDGARERGCQVKPILIDGITRVNVFLNDGDDEYTMPNAGASVTDSDQRNMYKLIDTLDDLDVLIISGSLPPHTNSDFLDQIIDRVVKRGAQFILDISSPQLVRLARKKPFLIKPNDDELKSIFGLTITDEKSVIHAMQQLHTFGFQNVLLTLGSKGAYFSDATHIWYATPLHVKILSSACAGDATLASFLSVWYSNPDRVEDALKLAMATGANVVESAGLGDFSHVDIYKEQVKVSLVK